MKRTSNGAKNARPNSPHRARTNMTEAACMQPQNVGDTSVIGRDFDIVAELRRRKQTRSA